MNKFFYLCCLILCCVALSCRSSRPPFNPQKKYAPATLQNDYLLFRHILQDLHPSLYWYTSRDSMDYYFDQGYARLHDSMSEPEFRTVLSYVISKARCGHTSVLYSKDFSNYSDTARPERFPLLLKFWKDTMVVVANLVRTDTSLKRGTMLQSINGWTAHQLEDTLLNYVVTDGNNMTGKYQTLSSGWSFSSYYKNVIGFTPYFTIDYYAPDSLVHETQVSLYDPRTDTVKHLFSRIGGPANRPGLGPEPGHLHTPGSHAKRKRKQGEQFQVRNLTFDSTAATAFMSLNTFERGHHLRRFFRNSFRSLDEKNVRNLVIDVRTNGGGEASNSTLLTQYIIDKKFKIADSLYAIARGSKYDRYIQNGFLYRILMDLVSSRRSDGKYHFGYFERHFYSPVKNHHFDGHVYILTGGSSFSATCLFAGALKGQKNVTIVGEETGGGFYGNTAWMIPNVTLPGTGVRFRLPRYRLVVNSSREKNGLGVMPDVPALPSVEAISKGFDFKTAKAKELIGIQAAGAK